MLIEILGWVGLLSLPFFLVLDLVHQRRRYDAPRGWRLKALLVTAGLYVLGLKVGEAWGAVLGGASLFDGAALGPWGGAAVGILVYELFHYLYHRLAHRSDLLWRAAHQMHHSAESLDAFGAFWGHPLDTVAFASLPVLTFFPLLGLAPEAAGIAGAFLAFNAVFQHANVATPRWLGYLIQRPESHAVHHGRGIHRWNYADLPLWDMVFGTFRNPARADHACGFYPGASRRVGEMLLFRDVSRPPRAPAPARGAAPSAKPRERREEVTAA